jgi:hypothetical protein
VCFEAGERCAGRPYDSRSFGACKNGITSALLLLPSRGRRSYARPSSGAEALGAKMPRPYFVARSRHSVSACGSSGAWGQGGAPEASSRLAPYPIVVPVEPGAGPAARQAGAAR